MYPVTAKKKYSSCAFSVPRSTQRIDLKLWGKKCTWVTTHKKKLTQVGEEKLHLWQNKKSTLDTFFSLGGYFQQKHPNDESAGGTSYDIYACGVPRSVPVARL